MPKVLIETPQWVEQITVPELTDSMDDSATVVEALTQVLADRTRMFQGTANNAALKNAANTFTQLNTFSAGLSASTAQVTGALFANGTLTVSGDLSANGGIRAADGTLELESPTIAEASLTVKGRLQADNGIGATDGVIEVVDMASFASSAQFNAPVYLAPAVDITYGPTVATQPQRLVQVDISRARVVEATPLYSWQRGAWDNVGSTGGALGVLEIPVLLPRGTVQWSYQVVWGGLADFTPNNAKVYKWTRNYAAVGVTAIPVGQQVGATLTQAPPFTTNVEAGGWEGVVQSGPVITTTFDPSVERWAVVVTLGESGYNRLFGLRLQFWDIGARNG